MADDEKVWAKAQADYRLGMSMAAVCRKYGLKMSALLKRIKEFGWKRATDESESKALVAPSKAEQTERVNKLVDDGVQAVINEHRNMTRVQRDLYLANMAELQEAMVYFVSMLDRGRIAELRAEAELKNDAGDLRKYLLDGLKALGLRLDLQDKALRLMSALIEKERIVWGITALDEIPEIPTYDDILEKIREPSRPLTLPENVVNFERRIR